MSFLKVECLQNLQNRTITLFQLYLINEYPSVSENENENDLNYVVREYVEGGIILPDFDARLEELLVGHQGDGDEGVQRDGDEGKGGQGQGAVRKVVNRIESERISS